LPRLAASQCDGQQEGGSWLESHGKCLCTTTRIQWCFPRGCDDTITIAFIKDAIEQFAAVLLAFIGAFYVGFGLQTGTRAQIITEWTVALGFFGAAMVGLWVTPWIVPAAYVVHGFWDYAHHQNSRLAPIPSWYPPLCAVLDWVPAAILTIIWGLRA
jgi:hypothetical protein